MKRVSAAEFELRCAALVDDVSVSGETILITKGGKPVAQLAPAKALGVNILGRLRGNVRVKGKITDPPIPPEDWDQD